MKVVVNNIDLNKCKEVMKALMICIKDAKTSKEDKAFYLKEYYDLAANLLIISK